MPQERGHRDTVGGHHRAPDAWPGHQPGTGGAQQLDRPDEPEAVAEQREGGRRHVADLLAGHADHGQWIRAEGHQGDGRAQSGPGEERGAADAAVGAQEAELVHREPDEREVEELDVGDACRETQEVHCGGGPHEHGERAPAVTVVQFQQGRGERDHRQVDADEPERLGHQPQCHTGQSATAAEELDDECGHAPHQYEDHGRPQQALQPGAEERRVHGARGVLGPPAQQGAVGQRVGEAADEEEDGHDLEGPGEHLESRHDGEEVADPVGRDGGHQPVAEYDRPERGDPEQVDVAVPGDGRRPGHFANT